MKIEIGRSLIIDKEDDYNWILSQRFVSDGGKERWEVFGYYSTLAYASWGALEILAHKSPSVHKSIKEAVAELRLLWKDIEAGTEPFASGGGDVHPFSAKTATESKGLRGAKRRSGVVETRSA